MKRQIQLKCLQTYLKPVSLFLMGCLVFASLSSRAMAQEGQIVTDLSFAEARQDLRCNGFAELCDRRYDQVAYATTHNAHSLYYLMAIPNQFRAIPEQLNKGIRGMMLDVYFDGGEPRLCHVSCQTGYISLKDTLSDIKTFLDANPNEVITLIFQSAIEPAQMAQAFQNAGLLSYLWAYDGWAWPTLRRMIDANKRLVVFASNLSPENGSLDPEPQNQLGHTGAHKSYPWLHSEWRLASENPYSYGSRFSLGAGKPDYCKVDRGNSAGLFVLNHFVTGPSYIESRAVNRYDKLLAGAQYCQGWRGRMPNFVTVDFYNMDSKWPYDLPSGHDDVPDVVEVVNELNRTASVPTPNYRVAESEFVLARYGNVKALAASYNLDDGFGVALAANEKDEVHEIFYYLSAPHYRGDSVIANINGVVGLSGFYAKDDGYRIAIIADRFGNLHEVFYHPTRGRGQSVIARFPWWSQIVGVAAFYNDYDRHRVVFVALSDGSFYEVNYHPSVGIRNFYRGRAPSGSILAIAGSVSPDRLSRRLLVSTNSGAVYQQTISSLTNGMASFQVIYQGAALNSIGSNSESIIGASSWVGAKWVSPFENRLHRFLDSPVKHVALSYNSNFPVVWSRTDGSVVTEVQTVR